MLDKLKQSIEVYEYSKAVQQEDRDFIINGKHWDEQVKLKRHAAGRPALTFDILKKKYFEAVGKMLKDRPSISVVGTNKEDEQLANTLTGVIDYIESSGHTDEAYDEVIRELVLVGEAYLQVVVDYASTRSFDKKLAVKHLPSARVFPDANTQKWEEMQYIFNIVSTPDCKYQGKEYSPYSGVDLPNALIEYWFKKYEDSNVVQLSDGTVMSEEDYSEDEPYYVVSGVTVTGSKTIKQCTVVQQIIDGSGKVLDTKEYQIDYLPIIPIYGNIATEGDKVVFHGLYHDAKSSQVLYNVIRSQVAEIASTSPKAKYFVSEDMVLNHETEWEKLDDPRVSVIKYNGDAQGQIIPISSMGSNPALESELQHVKEELGIMTTGTQSVSNEPTMLGKVSKPIELDMYSFNLALAYGLRRVGKVLLALIPSVYKPEQLFKIVGKEVSLPETIEDFDIEVKVGENQENKRTEAIYTLTELNRSFPAYGEYIAPALLANLQFEGKDMIMAQMQNQQAQPQQQSPEQQIALAQSQADVQRQANDAKRIELELMKFQHQVAMDTAKLESDKEQFLLKARLEAANLDIKQQGQDLKENQAQYSIANDLVSGGVL